MTEVKAALSSFVLDYDLYHFETREREANRRFHIHAVDEVHAVNQLLNFYEQDETCSVSCVQRVRRAPELEVSRILTLSTSHISLETSKWLAEDAEHNLSYANAASNGPYLPGALNSMGGAYSWVVQLPSEAERRRQPRIPKDMQDVLDFARTRGFAYVQLDQDGPEVEGLPTWDW